MGKRIGRGGRSPSSSSSLGILRQRIVSSKLDASFDVDAVADHLRSLHPDYSRLPLRPFTLQVRKTLDFFHRCNKTLKNDDDDDDEDRCRKTRRRKADESEERLLATESDHVRRQRLQKDRNPNASSLVSSDDSTSTSESDDAVFEARIDPEFDLTKSMLRDNYGKKSKSEKKEEHNMEIDAVDEKKRTMTMGSSRSRSESEIVALKDESLTKGNLVINEGPRFKDLGGIKGVLEELMMEVIVPLCHPQLPRRLGVRPMAGILLHGPPGCGKTKLAHAIANETGVPFYKISATEVVSGVSGASEENIRDLFKKAYRTAPSIVFIDEIDAIASKRENLQREMERRIVTQLMTCMDEFHQTLKSPNADSDPETSDRKPGYVLVIGATNRLDAIDQALRRPGRFDREIALGFPDENARLEILSILTENLRLGEFNLMKIARSTPGFVGVDLSSLVDNAGSLAMERIMDWKESEFKGGNIDEWWRQPWSPEELESFSITMSDFEAAVQIVQPSSKREGFSSIPSTRWEDIGGLNSLRKEFELYIVQRIKNPADYEELGVDLDVGFLLHGPPGCGKTLIAKAVANEAGANFIHIKGPEILSKYVGESELAVRTIFSRARTCPPCILFFDEVDALTTMRGKEGGWVVERLLTQLLIELDGADQRKDVYVIGATNRLDVMDPAVLRPGRFGRILYTPLPTGEERGLILKALARKKPVAADVDLDAFGRKEACHDLTGADLSKLINEAAMAALEEKQMAIDSGSSYARPLIIETSHFEKALVKITPSVSEKQRIYYETLSKNYRTN